jgi:hypothetical protein
MSGDEAMALLVSGVMAIWTWFIWYVPAVSVQRLGAPEPGRLMLLFVPPICAILLFAVLRSMASFDVQDSPTYIFFYMVLGAGWVGWAAKLLPYAGLSPRDDVVERGNGAAGLAVAGAVLGVTLCFAGGNIGDGPGWWVVVYSATLATITLAGLWLVLDTFTGITDTITIERDSRAGLRAAALLIGAGLILGRAVAGDWVSYVATWRDFVMVGWPALALFAIAIPVERWARPSPLGYPSAARISVGMLPGILYLLAAAAYVVTRDPIW